VRNEQIRSQIEFIKDIQLNTSNPKHFTLVCRGFTPEMQLLTGDFFILPSKLLDPEQAFASLTLSDLERTESEAYNNSRLQEVVERLNSLGSPANANLLQGSGG